MDIEKIDLNYENKKTRIALCVLFLLLFTILAIMVSSGRTDGFDKAAMEWVYAIRKPWLNDVFIFLTHLADRKLIVAVVAAMVLVPATRWRFGLPTAALSLVSLIPYFLLKAVVGRARPDEAMRLVTETSMSFPSGHTMNSLIFYGFLIFLIHRNLRDRRIAWILTALFTCVLASVWTSRVYLGVHYPTDILGGVLFGMTCVMTGSIVYDYYCTKAYFQERV